MENQPLKNEIAPMLLHDVKLPPYDHIELTDQQKVTAIREAKAYKARKLNKPIMVVELSTAEIEEALRLARRAEVGRLYEIEYTKKLAAPKQYPNYTAEQLAHIVIDQANQYVTRIKGKPTKYTLDKYNRNIIWKLAQYFTNDPLFETLDQSLNKGIALVGPVGCGKTMLMNLFRANQKQSYRVIGCQAVGYEFAKSGFEVILSYCKSTIHSENRFGHSEYGICFDDLGADEKRKFFGDRANALAEILEGRYRLGRHTLTHMTTNLDGNDIGEFYGLRTRSRVREMFNWIEFDHTAPDMRK